MQAASSALRDSRRDRSGYTATAQLDSKEDEKAKTGAKFLSKMRQDVYMDSELDLAERMNRQKHYQDRKEIRRDINEN